jgi:hypothetical protein
VSGQIGAANIIYLPFDLAYEPEQGLVEVYLDYWWECHPIKGLAFFTRPRMGAIAQCNRSEAITKEVAKGKEAELGHVVAHFPRVYVPKDLRHGARGDAQVVTNIAAAVHRRYQRVERGAT